MLRCIQRSETDPYFNIAAEEYLLRTAVTDTFMTWRNEPSVIIGKHQNASREINHSFIESRNLPVIRRITGGGAVYHDLGNINYSFIYTDRKDNLIDFRHFTEPVILFLVKSGLNAVFEGKNNILVDGFKVSGNSAHIYKSKVLHHGTLLFSTDLDALGQAVKSREEHYKDKAVKSVRAKVTNISDILNVKPTVEEFIDLFRSFVMVHYPGSYKDELSGKDHDAISRLEEEKYKKFVWNFGHSPEYNFDDEWMIQDGKFSASLLVRDGLIFEINILGPETSKKFLKTLENQLTGVFHEKKSISERLKKLTFVSESEEQVMNQLVNHLF